MAFNCPGHESRLKGLSGCGIDTVSAPLDTVFVLQFVVRDTNNFPATIVVSRLVEVVSPCQPAEVYCADLADPQQAPGSGHACGCLLYTSPSPRDRTRSRMPSSA